MITNLKLDLSTDELMELGMRLNGRKQRASRDQVKEWAERTLRRALKGDSPGRTDLRSFVCPKCRRPISLPVPTGRQGSTLSKAALDGAAKAADHFAACLRKLTEQAEG